MEIDIGTDNNDACIIYTDAQTDDLTAIYMIIKNSNYKQILIIVGGRGRHPYILSYKVKMLIQKIEEEIKINKKIIVATGRDFLYRESVYECRNLFSPEIIDHIEFEIKEITEGEKQIGLTLETCDEISNFINLSTKITLLFLTNPTEFLQYGWIEEERKKIERCFMMGGCYSKDIETKKSSNWKTYDGKTSHNWSMNPKAVQYFFSYWDIYKIDAPIYIIPSGLAKRVIDGNIGEKKTPKTWEKIVELAKTSNAIKFILQDAENWKSFLKDLGQDIRDGQIEVADILTWIVATTIFPLIKIPIWISFELDKREPRCENDRDGSCPVKIERISNSKIFWISDFASKTEKFDEVCRELLSGFSIVELKEKYFPLNYKYMRLYKLLEIIKSFKITNEQNKHSVECAKFHIIYSLEREYCTQSDYYLDLGKGHLGDEDDMCYEFLTYIENNGYIINKEQTGVQEYSWFVIF